MGRPTECLYAKDVADVSGRIAFPVDVGIPSDTPTLTVEAEEIVIREGVILRVYESGDLLR